MKSKKSTIVGGIAAVSILAIFAKFSGLLREGFIANSFGTSLEMDLYSTISIYPGAIMAIIASSSATTYLPIFVKNMNSGGNKYASIKFSHFLNQYIVLSLILYGIISIFIPNFADYLSYKMPGTDISTIILYSRLLFFTIVTDGIVRLMIAALNGMRNFGWLQKTQILLNIITILSVLLLSSSIGIMALIGAVIFNSFFQIFVLSYIFYKNDLRYELCLKFKDPETINVWKTVIPVFLGAETYLLGLAIDRTVGMSLGEEGITSALNYSGTLFGMLNSIIAVPIITVLFTKLSEAYATNGTDGIVENMKEIANIIYIIIIPLSIFLSIFASDFVSVILKRGAFDDSSTSMTASAFMFYALACPLLAMRELLSRVFVILGRRKVLVNVGLIFLFLNGLLAFVLSRMLGICGVTIGSLIASFLSLVYLAVVFGKETKSAQSILSPTLLKVFLSTVVAAIITITICYLLNDINVYIKIVTTLTIYVSLYLLILYRTRCEEFYMLKAKIIETIKYKTAKYKK